MDASVLVESVGRSAAGRRAEAEVFSALARLRRAGDLDDAQVEAGLERVARGPIRRYSVGPLLAEAWTLRGNVAARDSPGSRLVVGVELGQVGQAVAAAGEEDLGHGWRVGRHRRPQDERRHRPGA